MKRKAVKRNIRNTQRGRRGTSSRAPARPAGHRRAGPGERGGGRFFQVEMAPASRFITFRYHDVGKKGASSASPWQQRTVVSSLWL